MDERWPPAPSGTAAWVLNAMHEHENGPTDTTYHERSQARLAAGSAEPLVVGGIDLEATTVTTGGGLGRAEHLGPGWRRLRWAEPAERTGDAVVPDGLLPGFRCFPSAKKEGGWPVGITPPTEGSLDLVVRADHLGDAGTQYDNPEVDFSPSNLWAADHSWCLGTDYDLWGTKVTGPPALIEALPSDRELEAVRLR
ncbi:hypothetical protein ACWEVP_26925 [Amycolatopsis sp. NPDC003865]